MLAKLLFDSRGCQCLQKATCCRKKQINRCQKEEVEMILCSPWALEKELKIKLACDAGSSGPDSVSVRSQVTEPSYQLLKAPQMSHGKKQSSLWGSSGFSSVLPVPGDGHNLCSFCLPHWSLYSFRSSHTYVQKRQSSNGRK